MSQQVVHIVTTALEVCNWSDTSVLFVFPFYLFFFVIFHMTVFLYLIRLLVPEIVCVCLRSGLTWWMPCDGGGSILLLLKGRALCLQGHCAGVCTVQSYKQGPGSGPGVGIRGALSLEFFVLSMQTSLHHRRRRRRHRRHHHHHHLTCKVLGLVSSSGRTESRRM